MKKILMLMSLFSAFTCWNLKGQDMNFTKTNYKYVDAQSGLVLRIKPDANSSKIHTLNDKEAIMVFEPKGKKVTINGKEGYWRKAYYKDKFGYVFDAYLKDYTNAQDKQIVAEKYAANYYGVRPKSGLYLRIAPSQKSSAILLMPYRSAVMLMDNKSYGEEIIEGKKGHWRQARWEDKVGYVFDAYLTKNIND